jgi:hypothetical protein
MNEVAAEKSAFDTADELIARFGLPVYRHKARNMLALAFALGSRAGLREGKAIADEALEKIIDEFG